MSFVNFRRGSRSASSAMLFDVRTSVVKFGIDAARLGWICVIRFLAKSSVERRGESGKLPMAEMSLSVKSIASCGPATPKFSIVGILCPACSQKRYQWSSLKV